MMSERVVQPLLHKVIQVGHRTRLRVGKVRRLLPILPHVIERNIVKRKEPWVARAYEELVRRTHCSLTAVEAMTPHQVRTASPVLAPYSCGNRLAVPTRRHRNAGELAQRRLQIQVVHQPVVRCAARSTRPPDHHRNVVHCLVGAHVVGVDGMLAQRFAMVGAEDDRGVVQHSRSARVSSTLPISVSMNRVAPS